MTGDNKIERPGELPALVLAYVGDAVYELLIREHLVRAGLVRVDRLHGEAVKYVQAAAQARTLRALEGSLSEEEMAVVRRGRNAKSPHTPAVPGSSSTGTAQPWKAWWATFTLKETPPA